MAIGFDPQFQDRLDAMIMGAKGAGYDPRINSGYRSPQDQMRAINQVARRLYGRPANMVEMARGIPGYAAAPGRSQHQSGTAADFATGKSLDWMHANAGQYGVAFPIKTDTVHAQAVPGAPSVGPVQSDALAPDEIDKSPSELAMRGTGGGTAVASPASAGPAPSPRQGAMPMAQPTPYAGMSPEDVSQARQMGQSLMQQGMSAAPVGHWTQALARVLQAGSGAAWAGQASQGQKDGQNAANQMLAAALQGGDLRTLGTQALSNPWTAPLGQQIALKSLTSDKTAGQKDFEAAQRNPAYKAYQIEMKQAGRPVTTIDQRGESEFAKEGGKILAKRYGENIKLADEVRGMQADLVRLEELSPIIGTQGAVADVKKALGPYANALGIKIDGLDEIQAYSAIVSKIAPRMRPPGSGATSDFEFKQFLNALPQLAQTERGRSLISEQLKALNNYQMMVGDISARALNGEIDRKQHDAEIKKLGNPLELWRKMKKADFSPKAAGPSGRFAAPSVAPQPSPAADLINSFRQQVQGGKLDIGQAIQAAKDALSKGAQPEAIRKRLMDVGIDPAQAGI